MSTPLAWRHLAGLALLLSLAPGLVGRGLAAEGPPSAEEQRASHRRESIRTLEQLLRNGRVRGDQLAELQVRLADLYGAEADAMEAAPNPDRAEVARLRSQAIEALQGSLTAAPEDPRAGDRAILLGLAQLAAGQEAAGRGALYAALKANPDSPQAPRALCALGDIALQSGELVAAWQRYTAAAVFVDSDIYSDALFGLSRALVARGEPRDAAWTLERLVASLGPPPGSASKAELRRRALDELTTLMWDRLGASEELTLYLARVGEPERAARLRASLGPGAFSGELALLLAPDEATEVALGALSRRLLAEAQARVGAADGPARAGLAFEATYLYLDHHGAARGAAELRYELARLLEAQRLHEEAWTQYQALLQADSEGPLAPLSAEGALLVADEALDHERHLALRPARGSDRLEPRPMSLWRTRLVASCDTYAARYPEDPRSKNLLLKAFYNLYELNRFVEAEARLRAALTLGATSPDAVQAAELLLDAYTMTGDAARLGELAGFLLSLPGFGAPDLRRELAEIQASRARRGPAP